MVKHKDVLNEFTQARQSFYVSKLMDHETLSNNPLAEALTDNTQTPVDEAVAFRIDFPEFRGGYDRRRQQIMDALTVGHKNPGCCSQV